VATSVSVYSILGRRKAEFPYDGPNSGYEENSVSVTFGGSRTSAS
jgi:hypothetical protein